MSGRKPGGRGSSAKASEHRGISPVAWERTSATSGFMFQPAARSASQMEAATSRRCASSSGEMSLWPKACTAAEGVVAGEGPAAAAAAVPGTPRRSAAVVGAATVYVARLPPMLIGPLCGCARGLPPGQGRRCHVPYIRVNGDNLPTAADGCFLTTVHKDAARDPVVRRQVRIRRGRRGTLMVAGTTRAGDDVRPPWTAHSNSRCSERGLDGSGPVHMA